MKENNSLSQTVAQRLDDDPSVIASFDDNLQVAVLHVVHVECHRQLTIRTRFLIPRRWKFDWFRIINSSSHVEKVTCDDDIDNIGIEPTTNKTTSLVVFVIIIINEKVIIHIVISINRRKLFRRSIIGMCRVLINSLHQYRHLCRRRLRLSNMTRNWTNCRY